MPKANKSRQKLLSSSRPPAGASTSNTSLSSRHTRSVIRMHHTLQKQLSQAIAANDESKVRELEERSEENGGLELYQKASTTGQGRERGGDTSKVLVKWLKEDLYLRPLLEKDARKAAMSKDPESTAATNDLNGNDSSEHIPPHARERPLRILEVGALSTQNALDIPRATKVKKIDLHSQHQDIEELDFMALDPEETWQEMKAYDVLSLSLVVNFVGDARARGEMLRHTVKFLRHETIGSDSVENRESSRETVLPALFLVLPLSCVDNSRYLTEERLTAIMEGLGYEKTRVQRSGKLYYSLWRLESPSEPCDEGWRKGTEKGRSRRVFKKEELRKGKERNNFCIILDDAG